MSYEPQRVNGYSDLTHCRVFYGEATDFGCCLFGNEKKRLALTDKTKRFAIALFEINELPYLNRESWVKLNSAEGKVYADISSIAKRLQIPKNEIRRLAHLDRLSAVQLKETCFLEKEMLKKIDEHLSIQEFVKAVHNKNLNAHQLEVAIYEHLGMMRKPEIVEIWGRLINNYKGNRNYIEQYLQVFLDDLSKVDQACHDVFSKLVNKFVDENFFFEEQIANQNLLGAFKQYFEKINQPEINQLRDNLIELNRASPHKFKKHLDSFLKELYWIDKFYFIHKEKALREKVMKNRNWCDTKLILTDGKEPVVEVILKIGDEPAKAVKTDGYVYFEKPESTSHYIPYTRDEGENWILLDQNSLNDASSSESKACDEETIEELVLFVPDSFKPFALEF